MKPLLYLGLIFCLSAGTAPGQAPTRAEMASALEILEQQVALQQDRVTAIEQNLKATDEQIEKRIARVLAAFTQAADTPASGTRVLRAKRDLYDLFKRHIEFLARERGQRFTACYRPMTQRMRENLGADVTWLNTRIEKRIDQALTLARSLPAAESLPAQLGSGSDSRNNPAYDHQRQVQAFARVWREDLHKDLKGSVDRLQRSRLELDRASKYAQRTDNRQFVQQLIEQNNAFLAKRQEQLLQAITATGTGAKPLGREAANALLELLAQERLNNSRDQAAWVRLKAERDNDRLRLASLQDQLARGRQLLEAAKP